VARPISTGALALGLTPIQEGMVYESAVAGRPWANLEQLVCRFDDEPFDLPAMAAAWHDAQRRHPMLRASIETGADDRPVQLLHPEDALAIRREDWSRLPRDQVDSALRGWLAADRDAGIDLTDPPAMRVHVLELGPRSWVLVWTFHHALLDGRSFGLVIEEVLDAYDRLVAGLPLIEQPDPPSFADHVAAQAALDRTAAEAHFRSLLDGFGEPTPPPGADPTAPPGSGRHHERSAVVPAGEVHRLDTWAAGLGVTFGALLLTAWGLLLSRYTGRHDVVFGCTRAGRHLTRDAASMVGCLINTVPVRLRVQRAVTVGDLVGDVRAQQLSVRPHEHTALVDVERWAGTGAEASLIQTLVMYEHRLLDSHLRSKGGHWTGRHVEVLEETAVPMALVAHRDEDAGEVHLRLEYDRERWDDAAADRVLVHLRNLLGALADAGPSTEVDELAMLSEVEVHRLLVERNPVVAPEPGFRTLADAFEARVAASGGDLAVRAVADGVELTFADLDVAANRLARQLRDAGVGPEVVVGVCLPRSPEAVVSLLAVAKAGGAYLPLDPAHPPAALGHMLRDARAAVVVTADRYRHLVAELGPATISLEGDAARPVVEPPTAPPREALDAAHAAYVIYTSGSSGPAKGVAVSHRALLAYADAVVDRYHLRPADRVLQFASLSFDVSIEEVVPTLLAGAAVVLRTEAMAESAPALLEAVDRERLTVLNLPTAFWHELVEHEHGTGDRLPSWVRLVVAGGEKVSRDGYERWRAIEPSVAFGNGYGPTETTVTCTFFDAPDEPLPPGIGVPIGRPLANARAYVLGGEGRWLVPDGVAGELWIGGDSIATGYLGRPELTADRFRVDPWSPVPRARMYRTGDLARWLPSGDLDYLGRADRQVKLRGYRIEPGEVEAALERLDEVRQAFVAVRTGHAGDQLVAWVVAARPEAFDARAAIAMLRSQLPAHLVPASVLAVTSIPRTPNGKVDVRALPSPAATGSTTPASLAAAPDEGRLLEVCELFGQILGLGTPAAADLSFFDAGGHSLLAVRLLSRIERQLGRRLSLAALHRDPTPRGVVGALDANGSEEERETCLVPIQPTGSRVPLYGVHVLGTNACYYRPLAARLGPDQPVLGLSVDRPGAILPTAVHDLAALYADEIDRHRPEGPLALAAVSMGSFVAFELAQQLRRRGREVRVLVLFDAAGPGGRPQVGRIRRLRIHGGQLRRRGLDYLRERANRWAEVLGEHRRTWQLRRAGSTEATSDDDLWLHSFVLANVRAAEEYVTQPYRGRLAVIRAADELFDDPVCAQTGLGWRPVAAGEFEVLAVPGRHMTMLQEPHVASLASVVDDLLRRP
jgi:amino acid adenylation domain-containing protein